MTSVAEACAAARRHRMSRAGVGGSEFQLRLSKTSHATTRYMPQNAMEIWVDADACPAVIKEILFRAAVRTRTVVTLVANRPLSVPPSPYIRAIRVNAGFDVADHLIVERMASGDLVVTQDIPLAALVIAKGGCALSPRGEFFSEANIRERLSVRNFMEELRSSGVATGGPAALSQGDRQAFANRLDRYLHQSGLSKQGASSN